MVRHSLGKNLKIHILVFLCIFQGDVAIITALMLHKAVLRCLVTLYDHPLSRDEREEVRPTGKIFILCKKPLLTKRVDTKNINKLY